LHAAVNERDQTHVQGVDVVGMQSWEEGGGENDERVIQSAGGSQLPAETKLQSDDEGMFIFMGLKSYQL
jgi:hypothetical protein